jgi:hypothetical protein
VKDIEGRIDDECGKDTELKTLPAAQNVASRSDALDRTLWEMPSARACVARSHFTSRTAWAIQVSVLRLCLSTKLVGENCIATGMEQAGGSLDWLWLRTLLIMALPVRLRVFRPSPLFQVFLSFFQIVSGLHGYHLPESR